MYGQSIGIRTKDLDGLIVQLKRGLPVNSLTKLSHQMGVPENRLATTVNIAQRTLTRRKKEGRFKPDESKYVINPNHSDFDKIDIGAAQRHTFDSRLSAVNR